MDKYSKENLISLTKEITQNAHLGALNGKDIDVSVNVRQKRGKLPPNIMVFQAFAYLSATKLKPATNKVLMLFFSISGYENYVGMDVTTIMEELNLSKPSVVNALKELEDNNIIMKVANVIDKRRNDYFINPLSAWKGNSFTRQKMIKTLTLHNPNQLSIFSDFNETIKKDIDLYRNKKQIGQ
jgi:predicted transcriptional regulator